jgi:hypothetical protein
MFREENGKKVTKSMIFLNYKFLEFDRSLSMKRRQVINQRLVKPSIEYLPRYISIPCLEKLQAKEEKIESWIQ